MILRIIFTGMMLCLATAKDSHVCDCNCGDTYYTTPNADQQDSSCQLKKAGQLKFAGSKLFVCTGKEWKALQYEVPYGSKSNPGYSCKDIMDKDPPTNSTGVYWITLRANQESFPVYCDMAAGGWTMVFKAVSGVDKNVYTTYDSSQTSSEDIFAALDNTNRHFDHYKNRIVVNWKDFGASEVRVVFYKGGKPRKKLIFNAQGSDKLSWFSLSRLTQSPWTDIRTEPKNYFSIIGDAGHSRCVFINRNYGGCSNDAGWIVIISGTSCPWEQHYQPRKNIILYSELPGYTNWNQYSSVGVADVMVVYLR